MVNSPTEERIGPSFIRTPLKETKKRKEMSSSSSSEEEKLLTEEPMPLAEEPMPLAEDMVVGENSSTKENKKEGSVRPKEKLPTPPRAEEKLTTPPKAGDKLSEEPMPSLVEDMASGESSESPFKSASKKKKKKMVMRATHMSHLSRKILLMQKWRTLTKEEVKILANAKQELKRNKKKEKKRQERIRKNRLEMEQIFAKFDYKEILREATEERKELLRLEAEALKDLDPIVEQIDGYDCFMTPDEAYFSSLPPDPEEFEPVTKEKLLQQVPAMVQDAYETYCYLAENLPENTNHFVVKIRAGAPKEEMLKELTATIKERIEKTTDEELKNSVRKVEEPVDEETKQRIREQLKQIMEEQRKETKEGEEMEE